jgi:hypothetical protein
MMISLVPIWRYQALEEEFNRRQMRGEPSDGLVRLMIKELLPTRIAYSFYSAGPYGYRM